MTNQINDNYYNRFKRTLKDHKKFKKKYEKN